MFMNPNSEKLTVVDTPGLLALCQDAEGRNRSVYIDRFRKEVDPYGTHVLTLQMLHNDVEWRTMWFVKLIGQEQPTEIWLDVSFEQLKKQTKQIDRPALPEPGAPAAGDDDGEDPFAWATS
jgi:hypothetical protein